MNLIIVFIAFSRILLSTGIEEDTPSINLIEWWQRDFEKFNMQDNQPSNLKSGVGDEFDTSECSLKPELREEIHSYKEIVNKIILESTKGQFRGKTFVDLAYFVDKFGPRISGSDALEEAITYLGDLMTKTGLSNVHEENATIPKWLRFVFQR